ncbi:MAG TPA: hypothetical protein VKH64_11335 [Candidatus Binatia bacterium]|nr:hypothetical protein [Candidatus Binatia bacterium]
MKRRRGRPRKRGGGGASPRARSHSWLKPLKARPPAPFFDSGSRPVAAAPETALLCAVLEDAFACLDDAAHPELGTEARRWFFSKSRSVFSFLALCESLDLDGEQIRAGVAARGRARRDTAAGKKKKYAPAPAAPSIKRLGNGGLSRPLARK